MGYWIFWVDFWWLAGAVAGGVIGGAVGGGVGGFTGSVMLQSLNREGDWWRLNRTDWNGTFRKTAHDAAYAAATAAITSAAAYGLSDAYQMGIHNTVLKYSYEHGRILEGAEYIGNVEGIDVSGYFYNEEFGGVANFNYEFESIEFGDKAFMQNGEFSGSKFYRTIAHELGHKGSFGDFGSVNSMQISANYASTSREANVLHNARMNRIDHTIESSLSRHRYFRYWDLSTRYHVIHNQYFYQNLSTPDAVMEYMNFHGAW